MQEAKELPPPREGLSQRLRRLLGRDAGLGYTLLVPLLIVVIGMLAIPFFTALYFSFTKKLLGQSPEFIGLANYVELITEDMRFRKVALNSVVYALTAVAGKLTIGMVMALTLNQAIRARGFFRGLLLLPWVMPTVVTALTWRWMFDATFGVLNYMLKSVGLISAPVPWLADRYLAMGALILANVWRGFPFFGVSLLAGLQTISKERYEAAEVDGANLRQRFRHITIPGLRAVIIVTTMLSIIWTFNDFAMPWIVTRTGPVDATNVFATYTFQVGFLGSRLGYGIAATVIAMPFLFALILILSPLMWREE
jgi:multiple sugar transport system permease protein